MDVTSDLPAPEILDKDMSSVVNKTDTDQSATVDDGGDDVYFTSYEDLDVHCLMLKDKPRVEAYKEAILSQEHFFKDKIVMDVGAGTGILSLFCAMAGAKKVYAVEASGMAQLAVKLVEANNLSDVIEVIHKKVEDVILPYDQKVDVIVSEWMGFYLFHEGMLESVLVARDRHLEENGKMFPETARLLAAPCSLPELYDEWENFYGFDFNILGYAQRNHCAVRPEIMTVKSENILSHCVEVLRFNMSDRTVTGLDNLQKDSLAVASCNGRYQGICIWFECDFPSQSKQITLSTSPQEPPTHWKQTVIVLPEEIQVEEKDPVAWSLKLQKSKDNPRHYNIQFEMLDPEEVTHPVPCGCNFSKCELIQLIMTKHLEQC